MKKKEEKKYGEEEKDSENNFQLMMSQTCAGNMNTSVQSAQKQQTEYDGSAAHAQRNDQFKVDPRGFSTCGLCMTEHRRLTQRRAVKNCSRGRWCG